jgi:hypothetical protein
MERREDREVMCWLARSQGVGEGGGVLGACDDIRLEWDDLLIEGIEPKEWVKWLGLWSWAIDGRVAPAFLNKFGSWFLRRPDGRVEMLDVLSGTVEHLVDRYEDFVALVNQEEWQERYLLSKSVCALHEAERCQASTNAMRWRRTRPSAAQTRRMAMSSTRASLR